MRTLGSTSRTQSMFVSCFLLTLTIQYSTTSAFVVPSPSTASVSQKQQQRQQENYHTQTLLRFGSTKHHQTSFDTTPPASSRPHHHHHHHHRNTALHSSTTSQSSTIYDDEYDVLILGSGPAACAIATLLSSPIDQSPPLNVLLADSAYDRPWSPNYGLWRDEWDAISQRYSDIFGVTLSDQCIDRQWDITDGYFGGSFGVPVEERLRVDRSYVRMDKQSLKQALSTGSYRVLRARHGSKATTVNVFSPSGSLVHDAEGSTIRLTSNDGELLSVRTRLIVDCTGAETKLVLNDSRSGVPPPGYQIAYGVLVTVDESRSPDKTHIGPYDKEAMTLFDYRTDHFDNLEDPDPLRRATKTPTFMYAMPLKDNRIFFEETSLVARPAVSFAECKERCFCRLEHLGIKVTGVEEEEFCYIPMGGPLPSKDQRIIGFGGAGVFVHPSTGFSLARVLMGATDVARVIQGGITTNQPIDVIAAETYDTMWTPEDVAQRNFAVFGGEFLMEQDVVGLRGFFDGFFRISAERWGGFLAGRPGLPNNDCHDTWFARMVFGLVFIAKIPLPVAIRMFLAIVRSCLTTIDLTQSVTPLFGNPVGFGVAERPEEVGDVAAKNEARKMIEESRVEDEVPTAFV